MVDGRNLVLTGFMGTGKTTVGRAAARRLDRPFVDVDAEVEARAGMSIAGIFSRQGEAAFRRLEAAVCTELSTTRGQVIATGGGALVDDDTRAAMAATGTLVCLTGDLDELLRRAQADAPPRPMLAAADPRAEAARLLAARHDAYAAIPWQIDTTGRTVGDVAAEVAAFAGVATLPVHHPGGRYPVHIGRGLLDYLGGALRAAGAGAGTRVAVVSNPVVRPLYGDRAAMALAAAGYHTFPCTVPDGEAAKTLDTVADLYGQFLEGGLERGDTVLSLGGGVTGDEAGFAAATYLRGVRFAQVPTTLLAMIDASVGGKTGVDLPRGKNLVGAFKQPALVLIDPDVLSTLPPAEVRNGLAEMFKHALIADPDLFTQFQVAGTVPQPPAPNPQHPTPAGQSLLSTLNLIRALSVKIGIVEADPFERDQRMRLNLGHTFGHALEVCSDYALSHGEAVAVGLAAAARLSARLALCDTALPGQIEDVLTRLSLPVRYPGLAPAQLLAAMSADKKRHRGRLRFVLPGAVGDVAVVDDVPEADVLAVLEAVTAVGL